MIPPRSECRSTLKISPTTIQNKHAARSLFRERPFVAHGETDAATLASLAISPTIVVRLQNQRRRVMRFAFQINRNVGDERAAGMFPLARKNVLRENLHSHFHGSVEHAVHAGLQDDELADANRKPEIEI